MSMRRPNQPGMGSRSSNISGASRGLLRRRRYGARGVIRLAMMTVMALASVNFGLSGGGSVSAQGERLKDEYIIDYTLRLPKGDVYGAVFSPDEKFMVTLGSNRSIRLWETLTGRAAKNIRTGAHKPGVMLYHPKEDVIFTGGQDSKVMVWDVAKASSTMTLEGHKGTVRALATDTEGEQLFSGADDGKVIQWDLDKRKAVLTLDAHKGRVLAIALHPDGKHLATTGQDRSLAIWDLETGKLVTRLQGHLGNIPALKFGPDPDIVATGSADGTIKLWRWKDKGKENIATLVGHKRGVSAIAFHPNEKWLLSASVDESIKIWDFGSQRILQEITLVEGPIKFMSLSGNGRRLIAAYQKDRVRTWKLEKSAFLAALKGHTQSLVSMDFTRDDRFLISASIDKTVKIWNLQTRQVVREYNAGNHTVQIIRFAPDNKTFATGGSDGQIQIWDTATGKVTRKIRAHRGKVNALAFHPKGKVLLSGGSDKVWVLWDVASGRPLKRMAGHGDQVTTVGFSRDGAVFATGSGDRLVRVWGYPDGKLRHTLKGHTQGVQELRFDPRRSTLASASADSTIKVWDYRQGKELYTFKGHDFIVSGIRYSADGRALISVSRDKTVKLWDMQTGKFMRTVSGERNQIVTLALSNNGKIMATGSIAPEINLMIYPLKVLLAKKKKKAQKEPTTAGAQPAEPQDLEIESEGSGLPEIDESALADASDESVEKLAYKVVGSEDPAAGLRKLQGELNVLLSGGRYCNNAKSMDGLAHQILLLAPYDKAAYHALLTTSIIQQDLKMIYLMTKIGKRALFFSSIYTYDLPQSVDAKLDFWQKTVFDPTRNRGGRELVLEFVGCDKQQRERAMPTELLQVDIPVEVLQILARKLVRVNFQQFRALTGKQFLARLYQMIDKIMEVSRRKKRDAEPFTLSLKNAPNRKVGLLSLDLSNVDIFGAPGRVPFRLRREKDPWLSFFSDGDRRKQLLLPVGNYYLTIKKKVRAVFAVTPEKPVPVLVSRNGR